MPKYFIFNAINPNNSVPFYFKEEERGNLIFRIEYVLRVFYFLDKMECRLKLKKSLMNLRSRKELSIVIIYKKKS